MKARVTVQSWYSEPKRLSLDTLLGFIAAGFLAALSAGVVAGLLGVGS